MKVFAGAAALILMMSAPCMAQSLPNTGPAGNANGDSYGKVYSGARPLSTKPQRYKSGRHLKRQHVKTRRHSTMR